MQTDDGTSYHFVGYYADCGVGVGVCDDAEGDFPGLSHILGGCMMEVIQVPGGMGVAFNDFHGEIGQLGGVFKGAIIQLGVGGGTWTSPDTAGARLERSWRLSARPRSRSIRTARPPG